MKVIPNHLSNSKYLSINKQLSKGNNDRLSNDKPLSTGKHLQKASKKPLFIPQEVRYEEGYVHVALPVYLVSAANLREMWQKRASRAQDHRSMAGYQLRRPLCGAGIIRYIHHPSLDVPGVQVILTRVAPRTLDDDNLQFAFKAVRDGVADALGCKDNDPRVVWTYAQRKGPAYGIVVEVGVLERTAG